MRGGRRAPDSVAYLQDLPKFFDWPWCVAFMVQHCVAVGTYRHEISNWVDFVFLFLRRDWIQMMNMDVSFTDLPKSVAEVESTYHTRAAVLTNALLAGLDASFIRIDAHL